MAVAMRDALIEPSHGRRADGVRMSGSHIIFESLIKEGVDLVYGLPGGAILPLYHVMPEYQDRIRHVLVRHEQGAAHMADGYARATGRPGVCIATSGPGATNLVTGIATAMLDSSPLVAITGNVATHMIGKDAFQETDITGVTLPITKHNWLVMRPEDIAPTFKEAFHLATSGRPGPVLIDIPKDVQQQLAVFDYPKTLQLRGYKPTLFGNIRQIRQAVKAIKEAKQPVILAGHGVIISGAYDELKQLAEVGDLPVMQTLHGLSSLPESHPRCFGFFGMHGSVHANRAINQADLVIAIGMRFDDRACGKFSAFAPRAKMIHIDIDPAEIGKNVRCDIPVVGDVRNVLMVLNKELEAQQGAKHTEWVNTIVDWKRDRPGIKVRHSEKLLPQYVLDKLSQATKGQAVIVCDVGQHQMWAAQHIKYEARNTHISSGGLGTMGFGFPAAIGVKMGRPDETVWAIVGDGGFQMTLQELATAVQENVAVKIAIINNGFLGMVRQWQELFHDNRYSSVAMSNPDFVKLAEAYGVKGLRCVHKGDVDKTIKEAMDHPGPALVDFVVAAEENVYPIIPSGATAQDLIEEPDLLELAEEAHISSLEGEVETLAGAGAGTDPMAVASPTRQRHTIVALLEDEPGALNRVVSLFRARGFNIASMTVGPTETPNLSRLTLVVDADDAVLEQITKQLYKVVEVLKVSDLSEDKVVVRELALIKVSCTAQNRAEIMQMVDIFRAKIVDVAADSLIVECTGEEEKIDSLIGLLRRYGLKEISRTGRVAMLRSASGSTRPTDDD